ncbi:MAG: beta-lactamase family protein [Gemmatimonadetes bacterium]|nr:beta-lactamase family protein [Gemmatimonadota bacterium]
MPRFALRIPTAATIGAPIGAVLCLATVVQAQGTRNDAKAPPAAFADAARDAKLASAYPAIDRLMRDFAERSKVPGIAYGIVIDGKVVHVGVSGLRNVGTNAAVDTATVFRIASMTKSFTAAAILQLRDAGKLSLDDPAERYIPELARLRYPTTDSPRITIRHLLSHSEGFPEDNPWGDQQLSATDEAMARMMRAGIPFSTAPGTAYEYSNFGFAILGRIVSRVSGMPYARYVQLRILRPLGMSVTTLEARDVPESRLAHGYRRQDDRWLEEEQLPDGSFGAMGGMLTSVADLSRWVGFMLDAWPPRDGDEGRVLSRASRREMQQVWRFNGGSAVRDAAGNPVLSAGGYGYGLGVRQTCRFRITVAHSGGLPGFGSQMRWLPEQGVGIVAMGNLTYTGWGSVIDQAYDVLAATGGLEPRQPQPAPVLARLRDDVTRLVTRWDDALADSVAAMNLYRDESKERRRAAIERVRLQAGDRCAPQGGFVAENALRGRWRLRCATGDLRVEITLAPTTPARVQFLSVTALGRDESLALPAACR